MKLKKLDNYDYEIFKIEIRYLQVKEWAHPKKKMQILFNNLYILASNKYSTHSKKNLL